MRVISRDPAIVAAFDLAAMVRAKSDAVDAVNQAVGQARLPYLTDIPGQQAIYAEKAAEAVAYVAMDPAPQTLDDFPLMAAEVRITAPDAWQLAQVWLNMQAQLRRVGAQSEQLRLGTQMAIAAATNLDEIAAIMSAFPLTTDQAELAQTRKQIAPNTFLKDL
jgi:hypothetical protein